MTISEAIWVALMSLGFYLFGSLLIFKTRMMVGWAQKHYAKSGKFIQAYPHSNMVMKPWYPLLLRCAGIFIWIWALGFDCLVLFRWLH